MEKTLQTQLKAILELKANNPQIEQDIASILQTGAKSFEDLFDILQDAKANLDLRTAICWALGRLDETRAEEALLLTVTCQEAELRGEAARSLAVIGTEQAIQPLICTMLTDKELLVREAATYALGLIGDEQASKVLTTVLNDQNEKPIVRGTAAEALANLGDKQTVPRIMTALTDVSAEVRFWTAFALGELGSPLAIPALERLAETDLATLPSWGSVRQEATVAIDRIYAAKDRGINTHLRPQARSPALGQLD